MPRLTGPERNRVADLLEAALHIRTNITRQKNVHLSMTGIIPPTRSECEITMLHKFNKFPSIFFSAGIPADLHIDYSL